MANVILVGSQWGDEGKGKVIDVLTEKAKVIVRTQGGSNAGHTVLSNGQKYVLHLIPSGILHEDKINVIANGVVIDPVKLVAEIEGLQALNIPVTTRKLLISHIAHVVMPWHKEFDAIKEQKKGDKKIGTTKNGIGPTYSEKADRTGIRMMDLIKPERFKKILSNLLPEKNQVLVQNGVDALDFETVLKTYTEAGQKLKPFVTDTVLAINQLANKGAEVLFEGAQGTFLDIDHGTYPYVTSSNTTAGGACTGSGFPPTKIDKVMGVLKAYSTRVGGGPMPSEDAEVANMLHGLGREFGATTGRSRRCGWHDAVASRTATMLNGITEIALTNLDGLDTLENVKICIAYQFGNEQLQYLPADVEILEKCKPIYKTLPGWKTSTVEVKCWEELPVNAKNYLIELEKECQSHISIISVGPDREQTFNH